jgi:Mpv17 / PMP22 family
MAPMISLQFTALTLLEGKSLKDAAVRVKRDLPATATAGACYWPFIGLAQSRFVPVQNRPAVGSLFGYFWNVYLSHQANIELESVVVDADGSLHNIKETSTVIAPTGAVIQPHEACTVQIIDNVTAAAAAVDSKADSTSMTDTSTNATADTDNTTKTASTANDEAIRRQQTVTKVVVLNHHETQLLKPALVRRRTTVVSM